MKVKRESQDPIYRQLAAILRHRIEAGEFKPGMPIPPESELIRTLKVSRVTVRQSVDLLVAEGLVVRKQGKGTFVCTPKIRESLQYLRGLAELLAERGEDQSMEVLSSDFIAADEKIAQALAVPVGSDVLQIKRRHCLKGIPIALAYIYLRKELALGIRKDEMSSVPIYTLLNRKFQIQIKRATEIIRAAVAETDTARLLSIPRGAPLLVVDRVTYSTAEEPVEYIIFRHRHDSYEITVELQRDAPSTARNGSGSLAKVSARLPGSALKSDPLAAEAP